MLLLAQGMDTSDGSQFSKGFDPWLELRDQPPSRLPAVTETDAAIADHRSDLAREQQIDIGRGRAHVALDQGPNGDFIGVAAAVCDAFIFCEHTECGPVFTGFGELKYALKFVAV